MWKRKRTLKEEYGTLGHFLRGDNDCHYLGDLYIEGTNFYRHREWRGVRDTAYAFARWLQTWVKMAGLIGRDPVRMVRAFWKYRWLSAYLATPMMVDKWIEGDRGMVLHDLGLDHDDVARDPRRPPLRREQVDRAHDRL